MTQQGEQTLGQTALGQLNNVQNTYSQPFNSSGLPQITGSVANSGGIQSSLGSNGNIQSSLGNIPGLAQSGNIQGSLDTSGIPGLTSQVNGGQSWQDAVQQAQNAAYQGQTQYLDPQFQQGQESLDAKLANQGLQVGTQAYDNAQKNYGLQKQQAYQSAQNSAVAAGDAEQNTLYGQGLSSANLQNSANAQGFNQALQAGNFGNTAQAQQYGQNLSTQQNSLQNLLASGEFGNSAQAQQYAQALSSGQFGNTAQQQLYGQNLSGANLQNSASGSALQQALSLYQQPLNMYNALATGAQVQSPTFNSVPAVNQANTDVAGITNSAYQNQLASYQAQQAGINNLFGLGGSLGAAAILA